MAQHTRILLAFLLLGALTNVAVSWACVWFTRKIQWVEVLPSPVKRADGWLWNPPHGWPTSAFEPECIRKPGLTLVRVIHASRAPGGGLPMKYFQMYSIRSGWPWQSMESKWETDSTRPSQRTLASRIDFGIVVVNSGMFSYGISLPLRPVALPFALNTTVYSVLLGGSWALIRAAKRHTRAERNRCVRCAYRVARLAICPECGGAPVARASGTPAALSGLRVEILMLGSYAAARFAIASSYFSRNSGSLSTTCTRVMNANRSPASGSLHTSGCSFLASPRNAARI